MPNSRTLHHAPSGAVCKLLLTCNTLKLLQCLRSNLLTMPPPFGAGTEGCPWYASTVSRQQHQPEVAADCSSSRAALVLVMMHHLRPQPCSLHTQCRDRVRCLVLQHLQPLYSLRITTVSVTAIRKQIRKDYDQGHRINSSKVDM